MKLKDAINASQIWAARGYDKDQKCVVSVSHYGEQLVWLTGWGGNWVKDWKPVPDEEREALEALDFQPSGPKPEEQIEREVQEALTEIYADDDDFEPMGESYE